MSLLSGRLFSTNGDGSVAQNSENGKTATSNTKQNFNDILDPLHPPRLTFEHVKMLKNIDYSPLIERARKGDMFTVDQVLALLRDPSNTAALDTINERIQIEDQEYLYKKNHGAQSRRKCVCCSPESKFQLHYTNVELLNRFIDEDGRIMPRRDTGLCLKHQRQARFEIKRARIMALLSPTRKWRVPLSYLYPDLVDATLDSIENYTIYMQAKQARAIVSDDMDPLAHHWLKSQTQEGAAVDADGNDLAELDEDDLAEFLSEGEDISAAEDADDEMFASASGASGAASSGAAAAASKRRPSLIDEDDLVEDVELQEPPQPKKNTRTVDDDDENAAGRYF